VSIETILGLLQHFFSVALDRKLVKKSKNLHSHMIFVYKHHLKNSSDRKGILIVMYD
jgi:hypothetical protein